MTDLINLKGHTHFIRERCENQEWQPATLGSEAYSNALFAPEMETTTIWDLYADACANRDRFQATLCRPDVLALIEGEPAKYDDVLLPFLAMMRAELHANAGKGDRPGWLGMDVKTAMLEIFYHLGKLQKAVKNNDDQGVREYAADTANMCMMLVDIFGLLVPGEDNAVHLPS